MTPQKGINKVTCEYYKRTVKGWNYRHIVYDNLHPNGTALHGSRQCYTKESECLSTLSGFTHYKGHPIEIIKLKKYYRIKK